MGTFKKIVNKDQKKDKGIIEVTEDCAHCGNRIVKNLPPGTPIEKLRRLFCEKCGHETPIQHGDLKEAK